MSVIGLIRRHQTSIIWLCFLSPSLCVYRHVFSSHHWLPTYKHTNMDLNVNWQAKTKGEVGDSEAGNERLVKQISKKKKKKSHNISLIWEKTRAGSRPEKPGNEHPNVTLDLFVPVEVVFWTILWDLFRFLFNRLSFEDITFGKPLAILTLSFRSLTQGHVFCTLHISLFWLITLWVCRVIFLFAVCNYFSW